MKVVIDRVTKSFVAARGERGRDLPAVDDVSFEAVEGGITTLLGPSGSGKSTLLRVLAGLEVADRGRVLFDGRDVSALPPQRRDLGLVFQSYALFPTMNVRDNVAFGLSIRGVARRVIDERVRALLERVQLAGLERRFPAELSGGQRQRVAFARALAVEPKLLLLDEPFGALDARVRIELREWLRGVHAETQQTTILVTHDQDEALELSDRIVVMNAGKIEQIGAADEVYDRPATPFVASFFGATAISGTVKEGRAAVGAWDHDAPEGAREGDRVRAFVRAHDVDLASPGEPSNGRAVALATVERIGRAVGGVKIAVRLADGTSLVVRQSRADLDALGVREGDPVLVDLRSTTIFLEDYAI